jgi:putative transposase
MRQVLNAILYLTVTSCQWRMLPRTYPPWQSVYHYFRAWRDAGTWQRIHTTLRAAGRRRAGRYKHPTTGCMDSQSVKTCGGRGIRGYDAGKQVKGRTRHLVVDTLGLRLAVLVTAASVSDPAGARLVLGRLGGAGKKLRRLWVDGTYQGMLLGWVERHFKFLLQPVLRDPEHKGFAVLAKPWIVERTLA